MSRIAAQLLTALFVHVLAAGSAGAQRVTVVPPDPCAYDACAVRVEPQRFGGLTLVRGSDGTRVARVGFTGRAVTAALSSHQAAAVDARAFQGHQTGASIAGLISAAASLIIAVRFVDRYFDIERFDGTDGTIVAVGFGSGLLAGIEKARADRALSRAVWLYNRTTTR